MEIVTAPIPAQSPFIPTDAKIVVGAVAPASPDPIPIVLYRASSTGCSSGGTRLPMKSTGGSSGENPPSTAKARSDPRWRRDRGEADNQVEREQAMHLHRRPPILRITPLAGPRWSDRGSRSRGWLRGKMTL